ncbi:MAG: hypothetical protein ACR2I0_03130 [Rhodoferax sp.]
MFNRSIALLCAASLFAWGQAQGEVRAEPPALQTSARLPGMASAQDAEQARRNALRLAVKTQPELVHPPRPDSTATPQLSVQQRAQLREQLRQQRN